MPLCIMRGSKYSFELFFLLTLSGTRLMSCSLERATGEGLITPSIVQNCSSTQISAAAQPSCGGGAAAGGNIAFGRTLVGTASVGSSV